LRNKRGGRSIAAQAIERPAGGTSMTDTAVAARRDPLTQAEPSLAELRLALVCYGGVSLAIYMHGITV
jgi:hypothetical protein